MQPQSFGIEEPRQPSMGEGMGMQRLSSARLSVDPLSETMSAISTQVSIRAFPSAEAGKLSANGLTCNMVLSIIGTSVLGITVQMKAGGWLLTPVLVSLGCAIISEMTWVTSMTIDKLEAQGKPVVRAYQDFADGAFGPIGRTLSSVTSTLSLVGMMSNGLIIEAENLQFNAPIPWEWPLQCDETKQDCSRNWWAVILTSTTLIYAFVEPGPLLQKSAALGPVVCLMCVLLALIGSYMAISDLSEFPESCRDADIPYWRLFPDSSKGFLSVLMAAGGIAAYGFYCFAVVVTVPSLKAQMAEPAKIVSSSVKAYVLCTVLFLAIMLLGYWGFGNLAVDNLIDGMRSNRPAGWWAMDSPWKRGTGTVVGKAFAWMIIVNLLLTDAIFVPCTVLAVEGWATEFFAGAWWRRALARIGLSIFRLLVATQVESFVDLTTLTSASFCVINNILMPVFAFYKIGAGQVSMRRKAIHICIFIFGCYVMVLGSYQAISNMQNKNQPKAGQGISASSKDPILREGLSAACHLAYKKATTFLPTMA